MNRFSKERVAQEHQLAGPQAKKWWDGFIEMDKFYDEHGHFDFLKNSSVWKWAKTTRLSWSGGHLVEEQVRALTGINFPKEEPSKRKQTERDIEVAYLAEKWKEAQDNLLTPNATAALKKRITDYRNLYTGGVLSKKHARTLGFE